MAPNYSKFLNQKTAATAGVALAVLWYLRTKKSKRRSRKSPQVDIKYMIGEKPTKKVKAQVDMVFMKQLLKLMKITVPGLFSSESAFIVLVAISLIARSACDIWMIQNGTLVESALINMDQITFIKRLIVFFAGMPLNCIGFESVFLILGTWLVINAYNEHVKENGRMSSEENIDLVILWEVVNNVLKYALGELKLRLRTNLTGHLYNEYLKGFTYYKMSNLDNRISNADQLLTVDVVKFCDTFTDLYSNVAKPMLDIGLYVYRLTTGLGGKTPSVMMLYLVISGIFLTWLRKPTGKMTVIEQKLEGEFRYINSRLITNSEEIAFYQGNIREKLTLLAAFNKLTNHLRRFLEFRVFIGVADNIIAKYIATVVGFYAVSFPFLNPDHPLLGNAEPDVRFRYYYTFGRMLVKLAEAIGRLVLAGREMTRLAGFTARVTEVMTVLNDLNNGHYERTMIDKKNDDKLENDSKVVAKKCIMPLIPGTGKIIFKDNIISFDKVPLVTPNGDVLIEELSFEVKSGMNVLVCGPNGCGKSSLFRILGELWPLFGGVVTKPPRGKLFYIPQRPYMTLGTLRDQVIYPHTQEEMKRRGHTDVDLEKHLARVQLSYLLQREGGWDAIEDWIDVLSGGEKQRIAMARLFYHSPQFAILDECTSAVSVDVEGSMYQYCREVGITLFTVSHRRSLWKHHEYYLQMDGRGSFEFKPIDGETEEFGS